MYKRQLAISLLLAAVTCPLSAKTDSVVGKATFIQKSEFVMQPVFPVQIRVRLEKGRYSLGRAVDCKLIDRMGMAKVDGVEFETHQMVLDCPEGTYIVTGVDFAPKTTQ